MKKTIVLLLAVCSVISFSFVVANATSESKIDQYTIRGVSYLFDKSFENVLLTSDEDISKILFRVEKSVLEEDFKGNRLLSELLSSKEMLTLKQKGINPELIEVTIVETTVISESQELQRGQDTVSYNKSINYSTLSILGSSVFRLAVRWDCHIPSGEIYQASRQLTHVSGATGSYYPLGSGNIVSTWHSFYNGSQTQYLSFRFRLTTGGKIVQI